MSDPRRPRTVPVLTHPTLLAIATGLGLLAAGAAVAGAKGKGPRVIDPTVAGSADAIGWFDGRGGFSANGRFLVEQVEIQDVPGSNNTTTGQVILYDTKRGTTRLISHAAGTASPGNQNSYAPAISSNGRYVAFSSYATDLVDDGTVDDNGVVDIFLHDVRRGTTRLVSRRAGTQESANGLSYSSTFSGDGRFLVFTSSASDLTTSAPHVTRTSTSRRNLFVLEIATGDIALVNVNAAGTGDSDGDAGSSPQISHDGRHVVFDSRASDLVEGGIDGASGYNLYVRHLAERTTELVSVTPAGQAAATEVNDVVSGIAISGDGRYVLFSAGLANVVANDTNGRTDVFRRDLREGTTVVVSANAAGTGPGNDRSYGFGMSRNGRFVAFRSSSTDLGFGAPQGENDEGDLVLVWDAKRGTTTLVNRSLGDPSTATTGYAYGLGLTPNGRYLTLGSTADDLDREKTDSIEEVFLHDVRRRRTKRVTQPADGVTPDPDNHYPQFTRMSDNGRFLSMVSSASDLLVGDDNDRSDVFVYRLR